MTLAEELEQTGQDAARFRWLAENLTQFGTVDLLTYARSICALDPEAGPHVFRQLIDARRGTTVAPPGALYVEP